MKKFLLLAGSLFIILVQAMENKDEANANTNPLTVNEQS
jgi:hypothetical protein